MAKISILIVLLPFLCTILCNETSNNIRSNQSLETKQHNDNDECGISFGDTTLLLSREMRTSPGQWPWLVAIFSNESDRDSFVYQCAGTLLTNRHVLIAAHCAKMTPPSNTTIHPSQITVTLGRFNLRHGRDSVVINREVEKVEIHPDYAHETSADSNLAILTLKTPVEFSPSVRPICMWSGSTNLQDVVGRQGYVVFWGVRDRRLPFLEEPQAAKVAIVSQDTCLSSHPAYSLLTSERTFCSGGQYLTSGPCNGDSGSGLVFLDNISNRYQLRGVVSRGLFDSVFLCDDSKYVVYVDVAKYIPWIQQHISTT